MASWAGLVVAFVLHTLFVGAVEGVSSMKNAGDKDVLQPKSARHVHLRRFPAASLAGAARAHNKRVPPSQKVCKGSHFAVVKMDGKGSVHHYSLQNVCRVSPDVSTVAWGRYDDTSLTTGWADLSIKTSGKHTDQQQAYAAGYLEGSLTHALVWRVSRVVLKDYHHRKDLFHWFEIQLKFLHDKVKAADSTVTAGPDAYWYNVGLILRQFQGLFDGYNAHCAPGRNLTILEMWLINSEGDVMDLERVPNLRGALGKELKLVKDMTAKELTDMIQIRGHCSALVKWVPGKDLLAGHTTWDSYTEMYRIYKHYDFAFTHASIKQHASSFSSYPGFISSSDDFYMLDTGMALIETTLNILDENLYKRVDPAKQVMAWVRNLVANRVSTTPKEWAETYRLHNSGTYNDQWMIINYNVFEPSSTTLKPDTLWIVEQIPGYIEARDVTHILQRDKYWGSYNRPYFAKVNEKSMYKHYSAVHGTMFTYLHCPRAHIFRREQAKIRDIRGMQRIMMYNDWQNDPFSLGCPGNAIASRFDLPAPKCAMARVANGATDAKVTSSSLFKLRQAVAISGPTHDKQPAFTWKNPLFAKEYHPGQPDVWNFKWQLMAQAEL